MSGTELPPYQEHTRITHERTRLFYDGCDLWHIYGHVNGYSFCPNDKGISKLARLLNLKPSYIRKRITTFLEA